LFLCLYAVSFSFLFCSHPQSFGTHGSAMNQFSNPFGVALTPDHAHLVVVDYRNKRVVIRNATDGEAVSTLTPAAGVLRDPQGVTVVPHTGQVLVTDVVRHQVVLFRGLADPTVVRLFGEGLGSGDRQLECPYGVALVSASDVELAADPAFVAAVAARLDPTLVVIADSWNHRVVIYRLADAAFVRCFGSEGGAPGQFNYPHDVASVLFLVTFQPGLSLQIEV
jgi:hypothetical protein